MLHTATVEPNTLAILKQLMSIAELNDFYLVGGTCLSLRYGHRISVDLDLFSVSEFSNETILEVVSKKLPLEVRGTNNPIGLFGFIENVKVDFVKQHRFSQIGNPVMEDGIRMFSDKDIIAMKVNAILKRAQKKNFWDIAELLQHYSVGNFISFYEEKYPDQMLLISIPQAMIYFEDAEDSEDPVSLKNQTWESVNHTIKQKVSEYLR